MISSCIFWYSSGQSFNRSFWKFKSPIELSGTKCIWACGTSSPTTATPTRIHGTAFSIFFATFCANAQRFLYSSSSRLTVGLVNRLFANWDRGHPYYQQWIAPFWRCSLCRIGRWRPRLSRWLPGASSQKLRLVGEFFLLVQSSIVCERCSVMGEQCNYPTDFMTSGSSSSTCGG